MGTFSDIRDQRYRTELDIGTSDIGLKRAESDIISDIKINFYPISEIQTAQTRVWSSSAPDMINIFWISDIVIDSDVDIGMTVCSPTYFHPISEYQISMSDVGYRRH